MSLKKVNDQAWDGIMSGYKIIKMGDPGYNLKGSSEWIILKISQY